MTSASPIFFRRRHRGYSVCIPCQEGMAERKAGLGLRAFNPRSCMGCLVELEHRFASIRHMSDGIIAPLRHCRDGAGQEPVAKGRLSDLAYPDICAYTGNKKATGVGGFLMWELGRDLK